MPLFSLSQPFYGHRTLAFCKQLLPHHNETLHNATAKYLDTGFELLLAIMAKVEKKRWTCSG